MAVMCPSLGAPFSGFCRTLVCVRWPPDASAGPRSPAPPRAACRPFFSWADMELSAAKISNVANCASVGGMSA